VEKVVARDSGISVIAKRDGVIEHVDASRIVIRFTDTDENDDSEVEICKLTKFRRSNQNSCYNQKPIVQKGEFVKKGQIIADGPPWNRESLLWAEMSWWRS
jgi:DNA-directed RNA polymerase subunit beta